MAIEAVEKNMSMASIDINIPMVEMVENTMSLMFNNFTRVPKNCSTINDLIITNEKKNRA